MQDVSFNGCQRVANHTHCVYPSNSRGNRCCCIYIAYVFSFYLISLIKYNNNFRNPSCPIKDPTLKNELFTMKKQDLS